MLRTQTELLLQMNKIGEDTSMKRSLALVMTLLLLAGLCACGSKGDSAAMTADSAYSEGWSVEEAYALGEEAYLGTGGTGNTADASVPNATAQGELDVSKIIYSGSAVVETLDFDASCAAVDTLVRQTGGFLEASTVRGGSLSSDSLRTAEYTIRLPREQFETVTEELSTLGHVSYLTVSAENVAASYRDTESRLAVYRTEEERLLDMLAKAETVEDMLNIEDRLAEVRYNIESLTTDLRTWDSLISYSTLTLTVHEVEEYSAAPELGYWQKIGHGFVNTLRGVGTFFAEAFSLLIIVLPVLGLLAIVALVIVLLVRRGKKRRAAKGEVKPYTPQSYTAPENKDKTE